MQNISSDNSDKEKIRASSLQRANDFLNKKIPSSPTPSFSQDRIPWDKINCTYWWSFYPDTSHKKWFRPIEEGCGYSKKQGHNEAKDKNQLLISKIIMLCKNEYIQSCRMVIINKRPIVKSLHLSDDQQIVVFKDRGKLVAWNNYIYTNLPKDIVQHLLNIGEMISSGNAKGVEFYMPHKKPEAVLQQDSEAKKNTFKTAEHVLSWAEYEVTKKGKPFKETYEFCNQYIRENFPDYKI